MFSIKTFLRGISLALILSLGANQAFAACTQGNLTGIWFFTGLVTNNFNVEDAGLACKLKIDAGGPILNGGSSCTLRQENPISLTVNGGNLKLNSSCRITGTFRICNNGFCAILEPDDARMNAQKNVITWSGFFQNTKHIVHHLAAVKQVK